MPLPFIPALAHYPMMISSCCHPVTAATAGQAASMSQVEPCSSHPHIYYVKYTTCNSVMQVRGGA